MHLPWAVLLTALLASGGCIESRRFEEDAALSGGTSQGGLGGAPGAELQGGLGGAPEGGLGGEPSGGGSDGGSGECPSGYAGTPLEGCVRGTSLASGEWFSCGLLAEGGISCWGIDSEQVSGAPATGQFNSVAAGRRHACAIRADHTLKCWGDNSEGQAPSNLEGHFKSIAAGDDFTCGVHLDGSPICFGSRKADKTVVPADEYKMIATGANTACGVRKNGTLVCWGDDKWGIVSNAPGRIFSTVAVGAEHACAIDTERQLTCWGNGEGGEGAGITRTDVRPSSYLAVSAGGLHTAAITVGNNFTCFSEASAQGHCQSLTFPTPNGEWYEVAAGRGHTCILGDPEGQEPKGTVQCIGFRWAPPTGTVFKSSR